MPRPILSYLGSLLASDPNTYFDHPQTDGSNVCCIIFTGTNSLLVFLTNGATVKIADYPIEYQMNNGWMAYTRDAGTGQYQVWRRSPDGATVQTHFSGAPVHLEPWLKMEKSPSTTIHTCISAKETGPRRTWASHPVTTWVPSLGPFWQNGRWYATLGGSLFQIYTGNPQIISPQMTPNTFRFDILGAIGQHIVSQSSTDLLHWTDLATNNIADGASLGVIDSGLFGVPGNFYRLRLQ